MDSDKLFIWTNLACIQRMTKVLSNLVKINWFSTGPECPRGWAVNSDTHVDGSNLTKVTDSQVGEWKKLPGGEFLCHRIVEDAQEEA